MKTIIKGLISTLCLMLIIVIVGMLYVNLYNFAYHVMSIGKFMSFFIAVITAILILVVTILSIIFVILYFKYRNLALQINFFEWLSNKELYIRPYNDDSIVIICSSEKDKTNFLEELAKIELFNEGNKEKIIKALDKMDINDDEIFSIPREEDKN